MEQRIQGPILNVLTLKMSPEQCESRQGYGGLAVAENPPQTRLVLCNEADIYGKANRVTERHRHGEVVAAIEIISPGNKASRTEFRAFIGKSTALIRQKIHRLVIPLFPSGPSGS